MENLEHIIKIYEIAWQNVRDNLNIVNKYFSIFLVISGTFFVILEKLTTGKIFEMIPMLPILASIFIYIISLLFVSMFIRVRKVILRDLTVIKDISNYILDKKIEGLSDVIKTYSSFYNNRKHNTIYKFFAASKMLWLTTALVSSLIMIIGIKVSIDLKTSDLVCLFILFLLIHIIYEIFANSIINK